MKSALLFSFFLFAFIKSARAQAQLQHNKQPNFIDSIQNANQIESLLLQIDKSFDKFRVNKDLKYEGKSCEDLADSLKIKPWSKADFDYNGLTDLLIIGQYYDQPFVVCVFDVGERNYIYYQINKRRHEDCTFPLVNTSNGISTIEYFYPSYPEWGKWHAPRPLKHVSLIYKFGDFIEANPGRASHRIQKIEYSTTQCFGTCPEFDIAIAANRSATWNAESFNEINGKEIKGKFKTVIDEEHFSEIIDLLNYIDFEKLSTSYAVDWTDDQTCSITLTYDNGKKKCITDYGLIGTFGLNRLYHLLFKLRENQQWKKRF